MGSLKLVNYPGMVPRLNRRQRLHLRIFGWVLIGIRQDGNRVYAKKCEKHGLFLAIRQGYLEALHCDACHNEAMVRYASPQEKKRLVN